MCLEYFLIVLTCVGYHWKYLQSFFRGHKNSDIKFEPASALISGQDGLDDLKKIIKKSSYYLKNNGWLIVEHAYNQGVQVRKNFLENNFTATTIRDYCGLERITFGKLLKNE